MRTILSFGVLCALASAGAVTQAQLPSSVFGQPSVLPAESVTQAASWDYYRPTSYTANPEAAAVPPQNASPALAPPAAAPADEAANPYLDAMGRSWDESGETFGGACGACGDVACDGNCCPVWFGYVGGLWMTRDHADPVWFSYYDSDESIQRNRSIEAQMGWGGGFETRIGRVIGCGSCPNDCVDACGPSCGSPNMYAVEAVYWGVFPRTEEINLYNPGPGVSLNTVYDFTRLNYNNASYPIDTAIQNWFDDVERHRLRRSYEFHNVELNLLSGNGFGYGCFDAGSSRFGWTAGVRYFQFDEGLQFASADASPTFGVSPDDEMYYNIDVTNHLIGAQVGAYGDVPLWGRLGARGVGKLGLYGNHISHSSQIVGADGRAVWVGAGPNANERFDIRSSKNDVAFMAELDLGLTYQFWGRWRAMLGYRVVAVSGVAMATEQIPFNFAGIEDVEDIDSNGSLILHGGYAGLEFTW